MAPEKDKGRQGLWNATERLFDNRNRELKPLKRQKTPAKSFVWADELKRQFTYTLKPSKCSNTDITKGRTHDEMGSLGQQQLELSEDGARSQGKFFTDKSIENIFVNSEYFKMLSGNVASVSFCSGENGENKWTIDSKTTPPRKSAPLMSDKVKESSCITVEGKSSKSGCNRKLETPSEAEELRHLRDNMDAMIQELRLLNHDFGLVRMDLKSIEKLIRLQKQANGQGRKDSMQSDLENVNLKLGKFSDNVEKATQELRDFIENNRNLMADAEEIPSPCSPDFDRIIYNLHRLSETAYQPKIIQTSKGAKFEVPRELPITLYSDGMLLRKDDFRKYTDVRTSLFLRDIEDGFFPSELWSEFPYGVPFQVYSQVTDRRCEIFDDEDTRLMNRFPGSGHRLGSSFDEKPSKTVCQDYAKIDRSEASGSGEPDRRRMIYYSDQDQYHPFRMPSRVPSRQCQVHQGIEERRADAVGHKMHKPMSLRVRLGHGPGLIRASLMPNEKMSRFRDALLRMHEKHREESLESMDEAVSCRDFPVQDFEVHVYGKKPFRLSEYLNLYPSECGIDENCVVNITEI